MKRVGWKAWAIAGVCAVAVLAPSARGQTERNYLAVIEEKLDKLRADVEDLQFKHQKLADQVTDLQAQVQHLRDTKGGSSAADLAALEAKIKAVDEARLRDNKVLVDQLAKELAGLGVGRPAGGGGGTPAGPGTGGEHVVKPGETLSAIAKQHGITVDALTKANSLVNPNELKVGQKLAIPK
jgi:uncharacterized protein YlxW (UPF0749 family)